MIDKKLVWSERSLLEYEQLLDYLWETWGEEITLKVYGEIDLAISRIQNSPKQFPVIIKTKMIRRCVLSPQTSIFFKTTNKTIEIISLFDNRQNPAKRKL